MNKLNTIIIFLLSFVLLSPVFTTTSYAELTANTNYETSRWNNPTSITPSDIVFLNYTYRQVSNILYNYYENNIVEPFEALVSELKADNKQCFFYTSSDNYSLAVTDINSSFVVVPRDGYNFLGIYGAPNSTISIYVGGNTGYYQYWTNNTTDTAPIAYIGSTLRNVVEPIYSSNSIPLLVYSGGLCTWDGTSYFYEVQNEPDTPTFPTNAEIASAVQKFYNSDIYKNNTNFKDFIVVYSALKNTYAFIGTDNHMLQEIFYDGVQVPGVDFSSSDTWWRFNSKFGDIQSFLFGNKFYLYFIEGDSDVITNEGTGTLYDLFRSKYSMNMTIVYSTYDYDVIEYRPPLEGETDNQVTSGTIQGDSYTYDENLDPTDNEYSPLQNYVPSDPTQSILNDVDFDSINQAFEDGKLILNIENASWIFTANNQLVEYFLGFISFLIVLIAISRVLGG